jgi:surface polysaccharide O-acyltransferase-like enzyme
LKNAPYFGIVAALLLIICCFFPLAYYPDLQENFTGFYSRQNAYGKPGIAFIFLSIFSIVLFWIPKLWAKRTNHFIAVLIFTYALKTFILFSKCYFSVCPQIKPALIGTVLFSIVLLISSLLSRAVVRSENSIPGS